LTFVLDASIALGWCFEDETSRYSDAVLDSLTSSAGLVPVLWPLEIANGLLVCERRGRLAPGKSTQFFGMLRKLPLRVETSVDMAAVEKLLSLGRDYRLTSYDALYLGLAMKENCPLATADKNLKRACRKAGVELFKP